MRLCVLLVLAIPNGGKRAVPLTAGDERRSFAASSVPSTLPATWRGVTPKELVSLTSEPEESRRETAAMSLSLTALWRGNVSRSRGECFGEALVAAEAVY